MFDTRGLANIRYSLANKWNSLSGLRAQPDDVGRRE